eukprot:365693-Chlamydomonas_euryale.AAC.33
MGNSSRTRTTHSSLSTPSAAHNGKQLKDSQHTLVAFHTLSSEIPNSVSSPTSPQMSHVQQFCRANPSRTAPPGMPPPGMPL